MEMLDFYGYWFYRKKINIYHLFIFTQICLMEKLMFNYFLTKILNTKTTNNESTFGNSLNNLVKLKDFLLKILSVLILSRFKSQIRSE